MNIVLSIVVLIGLPTFAFYAIGGWPSVLACWLMAALAASVAYVK